MTEENRASGDVEEPTPTEAEDTEPVVPTDDEDMDEGPVRRPLIRATLPHIEGAQATPREPPVFTMHQQQARPGAGGRGGNWSGRSGREGGNGNGNSTKGQGREDGQPSRKKTGSQRRRTNSGNGNTTNVAGGNKWPARSESGGAARPAGGRRSGRRDKGRSR